TRTRRDQDRPSVQLALAAPPRLHRDVSVAAQARFAADELDAVAVDVLAHLPRHRVDDVVRALAKRRVDLLRVDLDAHAVDVPLAETRDVQRRLAERLRRDHAGVRDGHAAGQLVALDDRDPLAVI